MSFSRDIRCDKSGRYLTSQWGKASLRSLIKPETADWDMWVKLLPCNWATSRLSVPDRSGNIFKLHLWAYSFFKEGTYPSVKFLSGLSFSINATNCVLLKNAFTLMNLISLNLISSCSSQCRLAISSSSICVMEFSLSFKMVTSGSMSLGTAFRSWLALSTTNCATEAVIRAVRTKIVRLARVVIASRMLQWKSSGL